MHDAIQHIQKKIASNQIVFVACSGGMDSMALLHLVMDAGFQPYVLHVNFQLRSEASDEDESFLRQHCTDLRLSFQSKRVDTLGYIKQQGGNIQSAARNIRYEWFDELLSTHPNSICCTAHHQNDNTEQLLLKAISSGSLLELCGIPELRGAYFRPLLGFSKSELENYLLERNIPWREDASNQKNDYTRNKIRNQVLPLLREVDARSELALTHLQKEIIELKNELQASVYAVIASHSSNNAFILPFSIWDTQLSLWKSLFIQTLAHTHLKQQEIAKLRMATNGAKMKCGDWLIWKKKDGFLFEKTEIKRARK